MNGKEDEIKKKRFRLKTTKSEKNSIENHVEFMVAHLNQMKL